MHIFFFGELCCGLFVLWLLTEKGEQLTGFDLFLKLQHHAQILYADAVDAEHSIYVQRRHRFLIADSGIIEHIQYSQLMFPRTGGNLLYCQFITSLQK